MTGPYGHDGIELQTGFLVPVLGSQQIGLSKEPHGLNDRIQGVIVRNEQRKVNGIVGDEFGGRCLERVELGLCPIEVARVVTDARVAEFGLGPEDVVLVIEFDLREEERRIPDFILKDEDVAKFQFAQCCGAFVESFHVQYFLEKSDGLIGLLQVKGANVRQILGNLRRFLGEPQVVQCEFVILSERCNGFPVDRRGLQQRLQAHVERLGSGREEIRVLRAL